MLWLSAQDKPQVSIHLYSPQITVTNGSNSNLLIGYVSVDITRPTVVKSLKISFSGIYSAYWIDGTGASRQEYYQNKRFHHDTRTLTHKNLHDTAAQGHARNAVSGRWGLGYEQTDMDGYSRSRSRSSSTSSGCTSMYSMQEPSESSRHQRSINGSRQTTLALEDSSARRSGFDDSERLFSASTPALASPPPAFSQCVGSNHGDDAFAPASDFELAPGTHRFEFFFPLPPKMPSTIVSEVGGIEYDLLVQLKTKNALSKLPSSCVRATRPVHVINLPSRFALLQSDLPFNDEAVFTKQIEDSWWVLARLSSCTVSPGDVLKLGVCLSWPEKCAYDRDPSDLVNIVAVKMDLFECTVCKSLKTGAVIKKVKSTIASSIGHGTTTDTDDYYSSSSSSSRRSSNQDIGRADVFHEHGSAIDLYSMTYSASASTKSSRPPSPVNGERQLTSDSSPRGMFNQSFKRVFELQVPSQKQTIGKLQAGSVHIDCRSAPLSIIHEVQILLQVLDSTTQKLHSIPFHTRLIVVPEAESFLLPAYSSSALDTRVM